MELLQLESIVTTQLSVRVPRLTNNRFPNMTFTNEISDNMPSFPNVYVHELEPSEVGNTISNDQIHAIRDTVQIEVSTNTSKAEARTVINACVNVMKALRYRIVVFPLYRKTNNIHSFVFRARRIVGGGDEF